MGGGGSGTRVQAERSARRKAQDGYEHSAHCVVCEEKDRAVVRAGEVW